MTLATLQGPSYNNIVTFTSDSLPNNLATFPNTAVFNFAYYTTTVPDIDFFVAGAFACYRNPQPANVTTFYSFSTKEPYQNFLTCLNVSPTLPELTGVLNCEFCEYVDTNCGGITSSECAQAFLGVTTTSTAAPITTAAPTLPPSGYDPIINDMFATGNPNQYAINISLSTAPGTVYIAAAMQPLTGTIWSDQASILSPPLPSLAVSLGSPTNAILTFTSGTLPNGTLFQLQYWTNPTSSFSPNLGYAFCCYNAGIGGYNPTTLLFYSYNDPSAGNVFANCYGTTWTYGINCDWCNFLVFNCVDFGLGNTTYDQACITSYYQPYPTISAIFQDFIPNNVAVDVHTSTSGQSIVYVSAALQMFNWDGSTVTNFGIFYAEEASILAPPLPLLSTVLAVPISASLNFQTNITGLVFGVNPNRTIATFTYYADSGGADIVGGAITCNDGTLGTGFYFYSYTNAISFNWFVETYVTCTSDTDIVSAGLAFDCSFFAFGALNCALQGLSNAACVAAY